MSFRTAAGPAPTGLLRKRIARAFCLLGAVALLVSALGCDDGTADRPASKKDAEEKKPPEGKKVPVGDGVQLEILGDTRRVLVSAEVCLREGPLEQLLTRKMKKEHEAIIAADVDARKIHEALILARAKEGSTVRWLPKYQAPTGTPIRVSLRYTSRGKTVTAPARSWIKNVNTGKELDTDWVFAGSMLVDNPLDKNGPKRYLANDGDVICVSNFESALLDLPVMSPKDDPDRSYVAWTERIPPVGTRVTVILEPVLKK